MCLLKNALGQTNDGLPGDGRFSFYPIVHVTHQWVDNEYLAGIQTAVVHKGELVFFDSYGYSDISSDIPLRPDSIFRIWSMTKPIVFVALMKLYEEGKFDLKDHLSTYLPEFSNIKILKDGVLKTPKNPIRIIDLLRHTSGIGYGRGKNKAVNNLYTKVNLYSPPDSKAFIDRLASLPLSFEPGTDWEYGHSTTVCGRLIEVLSGLSLESYLKKCIFEPLGMVDTHFQLPIDKTSRFVSEYTVGQDYKIRLLESFDDNQYSKNITFFNGGQGLVSSTKDYLRFCEMLLNGGILEDNRILKESTVALMAKDHLDEVREHNQNLRLKLGETGFGLGFSIAEYEDEPDIGIFGWGGLSGTYFRIDPKRKLIYLLMIQLRPHQHLKARSAFKALVNSAING